MLTELVEFARREELTAEPGLKPKTVRWLLVFNPNGAYTGIQDLAGGDKKSKGRVFAACPDLTQQEMVAAGAGTRHFLVDQLDVVTLLTKDGEVNDKQAAKHDYFVGLLEQAADAVPQLAAFAATLRDSGALESIRQQLAENKAKPTELATFAIADVETGSSVVLVEQDDWHGWWQAFRAALAEQRAAKSSGGRRNKSAAAGSATMRCLLSGELVEPQPTHNKIEGLSDVGGLSMGDSLTSFDKDAFCSYGLSQGANAAMSEAMVKTYTSALNHLIRDRQRSHRLAGVKVIYWYSKQVEPEDDVLESVISGFDFAGTENPAEEEPDEPEEPTAMERHQAENRAKQLLDAIRSGQPDKHYLADCRFYALTLSANSGRVVIRDWMEGAFQDLAASVSDWFEHLSIVSRDGRSIIRSQKFAAVLAAPLRDLKDATEPLVAAMWRSAVKSQPIPRQVMAQTLNRVRIDLIQDQSFRHARYALLKAFCIRDERVPEMTTELNEFETNTAYLCGRIMAILAGIQKRALPNVGAGVVQRYYGAASATPALVLGRLVRTAQIAHLPKIEPEGLRRWFESQMAEVWSRLGAAPPRVLSLEEQTLFAMGYYHQQAKPTTAKSNGDEQDNTEESPAAVTE